MRRSIFSELARLAWPVLIAQTAVVGNGVIDTMMAGRLSAEDLAAVGIGAAIYITVFVSCMGVLAAVTPMVAHLYGAGRYAEIGEEVRQSAWLALLLAAFGVVALRHPDTLLSFSQLTPAVEVKVRAYLTALSWGLVPALAFRMFYGFQTGIGRPRIIMAFNLMGLAAKIPLNMLFVFRFDMGAAGFAAATATIGWATALLSWGWCARQAECAEFGVFARFSWPRRSAIAALLRMGLPIGATFLVDVTAFTFMALFIARLGPVMSAAHQIAANLTILCFMLPMSIGHAVLVVAGHALGAGDQARARHAGVIGLVVGTGLSLLLGLLLWLGADFFAALYTAEKDVRAVAGMLIGIVAFYHVADAIQGVAINVLRGYKKTTVPMVVYAVSLWGLGLAGGYQLGLTDTFGPARGAAGFWLAAAVSLAVAGSVVVVYFLAVSQKAVAAATTKT
jgi:MATE family multidrug resistance protein